MRLKSPNIISLSAIARPHCNPTQLRPLHRSLEKGRRVEGDMNLKRHHDPLSTAPSSTPSDFDPKRKFDFPIDPKSNPDDLAPYDEMSGDHNRSGMRSTEYACVDKKEPYCSKGGEHRYGGTMPYERSTHRLERGSEG